MKNTHLALVLCLAPLLSAAESSCCACPRIGFAGMPEQVNRSKDFALPLSDVNSQELIQYLARPNLTRGSLPDDLDQGTLDVIANTYRDLIEKLKDSKPSLKKLSEGGSWISLFDTPAWPLTIHDARIDKVAIDDERVRGFFRGPFVFVFYWRKLTPTAVGNQSISWTLEPEAEGEFSGLVIFPRQFAEPKAAR